jgi:hypothetical protein
MLPDSMYLCLLAIYSRFRARKHAKPEYRDG